MTDRGRVEGFQAPQRDRPGVVQLGATQTGTHTSAAAAAGKVQMQDFHFVMKNCKASPKLFLACAEGEHIKKGVLVCRKAGKEQQEFLKVTMSDLLVSSYQTSGSSNGDEVPNDQVSLNFSKIEFEYKDQKADGTLGGTTKTGYDVKAMKKV
ncbi:MAG: type VI secretion system tube protein Hcp [Singulisphaera sp.]